MKTDVIDEAYRPSKRLCMIGGTVLCVFLFVVFVHFQFGCLTKELSTEKVTKIKHGLKTRMGDVLRLRHKTRRV